MTGPMGNSEFCFPRPRRYLSSDFFRPGETSKRENFNFSFLLFNVEGNQTHVIESSDSDSKKLMASAVPESTKESPKYAVNVFEVKKVTSRLLIFSPTQI